MERIVAGSYCPNHPASPLDLSHMSYAMLNPQPVVDAVSMARLGGTIVLAGLKGRDRGVDGFPSDDVAMRYQTVIGVRTVDYHSYRQAVRLIESGNLPVDLLHTHHFPLEQAAEAVQTLVQAGIHEAVSITVEP